MEATIKTKRKSSVKTAKATEKKRINPTWAAAMSYKKGDVIVNDRSIFL